MHENRETSVTPAVESGSRSAGEGIGHTARVYISVESHCGIVPGIIRTKTEYRRRRVRREGCGSRGTLSHSTRTRLSGDCACPTGGRVCVQATYLAVIHLREEPDALRS